MTASPLNRSSLLIPNKNWVSALRDAKDFDAFKQSLDKYEALEEQNYIAIERWANAVTGIWVTYTPAWTATTTNPTLGNGTITGLYQIIGKTLDVAISLTAGTTTLGGLGIYKFGFPPGVKAVSTIQTGSAYLDESNTAGGAIYVGICRAIFTDGMSVEVTNPGAGNTVALTNAVPVAFATANNLVNMSARVAIV